MRRVNVGLVYGILHRVALGCVAEVTEEVSASIFRVEISRGSKMLRLYMWVVSQTDKAGKQASAWCKLTGVVNRDCEKVFFPGRHLGQKAVAHTVKYRCH